MQAAVEHLNIGQQAKAGHRHHAQSRKHRIEPTRCESRHRPGDGSRESDWFDEVAGQSAIHALVTRACTCRVEMSSTLPMKNGPASLNLMSRIPAMNCWTRRLRPWLVSSAISLIVRTRLRVMRMNAR